MYLWHGLNLLNNLIGFLHFYTAQNISKKNVLKWVKATQLILFLQSFFRQGILQKHKRWREHFNLRIEREKISTVLESVWALKTGARFYLHVVQKDVRNYLFLTSLVTSDRNDGLIGTSTWKSTPQKSGVYSIFIFRSKRESGQVPTSFVLRV